MDHGLPGTACSLVPHRTSQWMRLLGPPSGPPGLPQISVSGLGTPPPSVAFPSVHSSLGDCPRLWELLRRQNPKHLEAYTPHSGP